MRNEAFVALTSQEGGSKLFGESTTLPATKKAKKVHAQLPSTLALTIPAFGDFPDTLVKVLTPKNIKEDVWLHLDYSTLNTFLHFVASQRLDFLAKRAYVKDKSFGSQSAESATPSSHRDDVVSSQASDGLDSQAV